MNSKKTKPKPKKLPNLTLGNIQIQGQPSVIKVNNYTTNLREKNNTPGHAKSIVSENVIKQELQTKDSQIPESLVEKIQVLDSNNENSNEKKSSIVENLPKNLEEPILVDSLVQPENMSVNVNKLFTLERDRSPPKMKKYQAMGLTLGKRPHPYNESKTAAPSFAFNNKLKQQYATFYKDQNEKRSYPQRELNYRQSKTTI